MPLPQAKSIAEFGLGTIAILAISQIALFGASPVVVILAVLGSGGVFFIEGVKKKKKYKQKHHMQHVKKIIEFMIAERKISNTVTSIFTNLKNFFNKEQGEETLHLNENNEGLFLKNITIAKNYINDIFITTKAKPSPQKSYPTQSPKKMQRRTIVKNIIPEITIKSNRENRRGTVIKQLTITKKQEKNTIDRF